MTRAHDIAVEHCLTMKLAGLKPCDVLAPIGFPHNPQTSWDAAVRLVARAWSKLDTKRSAS
ncbi:hypothetical protein J2847_005850 [Azospirillum agricola]|uniref:hypothetical protein n=1 Tax=Azospirillum agricola TaxID=1720247 RepID=UPI001AE7CC30|nr:hypothetical protein [Azospirillum agricola]MBP2232521.1 hypothetical protein [Azospirillum agricola]